MLNRHRKPFSVIIPTLNEGRLLHMTIESILIQTDYPEYEVIIVNDGSTDGSCEPFKNSEPRIRVLSTNRIGVAKARNLGVRHAHGELIVFIDAHCRVSRNWLSRFEQALSSIEVGVVGPCFTRLEETEPRGCGMVWSDHTLNQTWYEPLTIAHPYKVPLTPGGCQAFRRSTFQSIGQYDEGFSQWGFEDVEICLRAWLLGYRVMVDPTVVIAHYFRESRNYEVNDAAVTYNFLRMIHFHLSPHRIRRILRAISANPLVPEALDRLYTSDVFKVRAGLVSARVHNDDWYFSVINGPIKDD